MIQDVNSSSFYSLENNNNAISIPNHTPKQLTASLVVFFKYFEKTHSRSETLGKFILSRLQQIQKTINDKETQDQTDLEPIFALSRLFWDYLSNEHGIHSPSKLDTECNHDVPQLAKEMYAYDIDPKNAPKTIDIDSVIKEFTKISLFIPEGKEPIEKRMNALVHKCISIKPGTQIATLRRSEQPGQISRTLLILESRYSIKHSRYSAEEIKNYQNYTLLFNELFRKRVITKEPIESISLIESEEQSPSTLSTSVVKMPNFPFTPPASPQAKSKRIYMMLATKHQDLEYTIQSLPFYIPDMNREQAEKYLASGQFCIRPSSSKSEVGNTLYTLSFASRDCGKLHYLLTYNDEGKLIINGNEYKSLTDFLEEFQKYNQPYTQENFLADRLNDSKI